MSNLDLFRRSTLSQVAQTLDVSPFDIARYYGQNGGPPAELQFSQEECQELGKKMGLQAWREEHNFTIEDAQESRRLVRELALFVSALSPKKTLRYDYILRGFDSTERNILAKATNILLDLGVLKSQNLQSGNGFSRNPDAPKGLLADLNKVDSLPAPLQELWA